MSRRAGRAPRIRRLALVGAALGAAAGLALGLGPAAPASAHNYLVSSTPAAGETVTEQPGTITITTNDNLLDLGDDGTGSAIQVLGPGDETLYYGDGCVSVLGPTVSMDAQLGAAGEYSVVWQVVSTDGHPVSDEYTFEWAPAADAVLAEGSATPPDCDGTNPVTGGGSGESTLTAESPSADAASGAALGDIAWIGAALAAVVVAGGATLLLLRRRAS